MIEELSSFVHLPTDLSFSDGKGRMQQQSNDEFGGQAGCPTLQQSLLRPARSSGAILASRH
jgi:hypothetical protein